MSNVGLKIWDYTYITSPECVNRLIVNAQAKTSRKQHEEVYNHAEIVQMDIW